MIELGDVRRARISVFLAEHGGPVPCRGPPSRQAIGSGALGGTAVESDASSVRGTESVFIALPSHEVEEVATYGPNARLEPEGRTSFDGGAGNCEGRESKLVPVRRDVRGSEVGVVVIPAVCPRPSAKSNGPEMAQAKGVLVLNSARPTPALPGAACEEPSEVAIARLAEKAGRVLEGFSPAVIGVRA